MAELFLNYLRGREKGREEEERGRERERVCENIPICGFILQMPTTAGAKAAARDSAWLSHVAEDSNYLSHHRCPPESALAGHWGQEQSWGWSPGTDVGGGHLNY